MTKSDFINLFDSAVNDSYKFAKEFVTDELSKNFMYMVNINSPYEDLKMGQKTYHELATGRNKFTPPLNHGEVIDLLWSEGKIPVWIDIAVYGVGNERTYFSLHCANCFTSNESELTYFKRGQGPFGIKSPSLPASYRSGKFSLQHIE